MATKKPLKAAKPAAKQPVKKTAPAKKVVAKPVKKAAAKPPKKAALAVKKSAPAAAKQVQKKVVTPKKVAQASKPVAKPATKKTVAKAPAKKVVAKAPAKKVVARPATNKTTNKPVKKATEKKEVKAAAPVKKAAVVPEKKVAAKAAVPAAKAPVKKAATKAVEPTPAPAPAAAKAPAAKPAPKKEEKAPKPVVIPKTSTDKKVDYEPDFTRSVLDTPPPAPQGPTMRYSDQELQEFRDLINKKLDAAKKELAYLQGLITRRDEMGGDETDNRYMTMEDGGMSMEREQLSQMASRQITFIDHLEKAIMRIENKTYGICRVTGKLIDKARLRAVPHATLSMEAKLGIVK